MVGLHHAFNCVFPVTSGNALHQNHKLNLNLLRTAISCAIRYIARKWNFCEISTSLCAYQRFLPTMRFESTSSSQSHIHYLFLLTTITTLEMTLHPSSTTTIHFSIAMSILISATCVVGLHVPMNVTEGVYSVFTYINGTEVHAHIRGFSDANTNALVASCKLNRQRTALTTTACYSDEGTEDLDHRTCDAAVLWTVICFQTHYGEMWVV